MTTDEKIQAYLSGNRFAVAGASRDRDKYGNKVLRAYQQNSLDVIPINPSVDRVEGLTAVPNVAGLPRDVHGISIVTPPQATERIVADAIDHGIKHIWMQPGAESPLAIEFAERNGANVIAGGPCILVALRYREVS